MGGVLYHFVGSTNPSDDEENFELLQKIYEAQIIENPRFGEEPCRIEMDTSRIYSHGELIKQSVTCFAEIPFSELGLHVTKYSRFGFGVDASQVIRCGGRPVSYVPIPRSDPSSWGHSMMRDLVRVIEAINERPWEAQAEERTREMGKKPASIPQLADVVEDYFKRDFLAFLKFYDSDLPESHPLNFRSEREWRKYGGLHLGPSLREIIVPESFAQRAREAFPEAREKVCPIL